jgi:DNA transformation protein
LPRKSEFLTLVSELLSTLGAVRARSLFGGHGLYVDDLFCAIVMDDVLYFKVDAHTRGRFEAAGCAPFKPFADRALMLQYCEAPAEIFEDPAAFRQWAMLARDAALRSAAVKTRGRAKKSER